MYERISEMELAIFQKKNGYTSGRKRNWGVKAILCCNARVLALNFLGKLLFRDWKWSSRYFLIVASLCGKFYDFSFARFEFALGLVLVLKFQALIFRVI